MGGFFSSNNVSNIIINNDNGYLLIGNPFKDFTMQWIILRISSPKIIKYIYAWSVVIFNLSAIIFKILPHLNIKRIRKHMLNTIPLLIYWWNSQWNLNLYISTINAQCSEIRNVLSIYKSSKYIMLTAV